MLDIDMQPTAPAVPLILCAARWITRKRVLSSVSSGSSFCRARRIVVISSLTSSMKRASIASGESISCPLGNEVDVAASVSSEEALAFSQSPISMASKACKTARSSADSSFELKLSSIGGCAPYILQHILQQQVYIQNQRLILYALYIYTAHR